MCVCVTFAVYTDRESWTRPIYANLGPKVWEYGPTRERVGRVSSHTVSRWSRSPGCCAFRGVFWVRRDFFCALFIYFVFFESTRPAASMNSPCLIYLPLVSHIGQPHITYSPHIGPYMNFYYLYWPTYHFMAVIMKPVLAFRPKSLSTPGFVGGCHCLFSLSVRVSVSVFMCNIRRFYCLWELYEADFYKPGIYRSGRVWVNAWGAFRRAPSRGCLGGRELWISWCVLGASGSFFSFIVRVFLRTQCTPPAASMRPQCCIHLSTST